MFEFDEKTLQMSINSLKNMNKSKITQSEKEFKFTSFEVKNHPYRVAAVDGSNHNLKGINFVFTTLRAGHLIYQEGKMVDKKITPIKLEILLNSNDKTKGYFKNYRDYYFELTKEMPDEFLEFEKAPERLRTIMEWKIISDLVDTLSAGDIVIFDGSLISGAISTNHLYYDDLITKARSQGISLIGLSKDTSLSLDSVSIPIVLREAAKKQAHNRNWYVELEETYFVKFSRESELIYRFDAVFPSDISIEELLSRIGAYAFSENSFAYPYPMMRIHDEVRISQMDMEQCFNELKSKWIKSYNPQNTHEVRLAIKEFEEMFFIYHDHLDVMSRGR